MKRWLLPALLLIAGAQISDSAPPRVSFVRRFRIVSSQERIRFEIRIPPNKDNRQLVMAAFDAGDPFPVSSTVREIAGEAAPALWNIDWRLPDMDGEVVAALFSASGKQIGRDSFLLCVRGVLGECPSLSVP